MSQPNLCRQCLTMTRKAVRSWAWWPMRWEWSEGWWGCPTQLTLTKSLSFVAFFLKTNVKSTGIERLRENKVNERINLVRKNELGVGYVWWKGEKMRLIGWLPDHLSFGEQLDWARFCLVSRWPALTFAPKLPSSTYILTIQIWS